MTREEVGKLFTRIKIHYSQFRSKDQDVFNEWCRYLQNYQNDGVMSNFDKYLKEANEEPPKVTNLIDEFIKLDNIKIKKWKCACCGKSILVEEYNTHYDKCMSIDYICKNSELYYGKTINKKMLWDMPQKEFEQKYWQFCGQLYNSHKLDSLKEKCLKNALLVYYGYEPTDSIESVLKNLATGIKG